MKNCFNVNGIAGRTRADDCLNIIITFTRVTRLQKVKLLYFVIFTEIGLNLILLEGQSIMISGKDSHFTLSKKKTLNGCGDVKISSKGSLLLYAESISVSNTIKRNVFLRNTVHKVSLNDPARNINVDFVYEIILLKILADFRR